MFQVRPPPASQPRHRGLARFILGWQQRLPGVRVRIAKRDVDSAFKLILVNLGDVGLFATELPGEPLGLSGSVLVLYLVLTFGGGGLPWQLHGDGEPGGAAPRGRGPVGARLAR